MNDTNKMSIKSNSPKGKKPKRSTVPIDAILSAIDDLKGLELFTVMVCYDILIKRPMH